MGSVNSSMVRYVLPDVGYEDATGETHYEIKDHLGNLRVSYTLEWCATCGTECPNQTVEYRIDYVADYFAYGGIMREYIRLNTDQERFLSTGNERDKPTGWDYRNARYYDSDIGRFLGVDPMTSAAFSWSSYRYAFDNPILFIDPSGLFEGWYETIEGALAFNPNINSRDEYEAAIKSGDIINGKRWIGREKVYSVDGIGWMLTADGQAISTENDQWQYFGEAVVRGDKIENVAQSSGGVGQPGDWESIIPVWGSGRAAVDHFQNGNYWSGLGYTALAVSDVFLVKSIATGIGRGTWKLGSHSWSATRKWMGKQGYAESGQHVHHWAVHQATAKKYGLEAVTNQPWNLMPMSSPALHQSIHGVGPNAFGPMGQFWYGTPTWFKAGMFSGGGRIID